MLNGIKHFDNRGYFIELYNRSKLTDLIGYEPEFVQDNISMSSNNVVRGLHFQTSQFIEDKLVTCISGKITDLILDIRVGSPTYGKLFSCTLCKDDNKSLWIPRGFAHGFISHDPKTLIHYKVTATYSSENAETINIQPYIDPNIIDLDMMIISERDQSAKLLDDFASTTLPKFNG